MASSETELPIPPVDFRRAVGPADPAAFDNPTGEKIYPGLPDAAYESVFDFGCGCGRVARQLIQQDVRPERYVGIDLHAEMVAWCQDNLTPAAPGFTFHHHDVHHQFFNPDPDKPMTLPFPAQDDSATLLIAHSVFTHIVEDETAHYLSEIGRVLRDDGVALVTFFLFDKARFPMMTDFRNALYTDPYIPTDAVILDRAWLLGLLERAGLAITEAQAPGIHGHQWLLTLRPLAGGAQAIELPPDDASIHQPDAQRVAISADEHADEVAAQRRAWVASVRERANAQVAELEAKLAESERRRTAIEGSRAYRLAIRARRPLDRLRGR